MPFVDEFALDRETVLFYGKLAGLSEGMTDTDSLGEGLDRRHEAFFALSSISMRESHIQVTSSASSGFSLNTAKS